MAFDADEMIPYKGTMITKGAIFHRVKGLGWNMAAFGQLSDEEAVRVLEERKTPAAMGKSLETAFKPSQVVDLNSEEGSDPSVMGPPGTIAREDPPAPTGPVLESGVAVTAVAPPSFAGRHARPIDPSKGGAEAQAQPQKQTYSQPVSPVRPAVPVVRPPKTDASKLMAMLDAAFQLAGNEGTMNTAKVLIQTNGLERAFQSLYPDLAKKVLGRFDTTPDIKCRGGTILDIEMEAEHGYVHIITNAGTITITGINLVHKGAEA